MNYKHALILTGLLPSLPALSDTAEEPTYQGEDMIITTAHKLFPNTTIATPKFEITKEDIDKTNLTSAEDAIRMAPSVQVRRRFYGDTNGVTAIRGSTNFQTNHFNMYVDGIPLHNPVQTKWNGAPKWNLIAPNAIESTSVLYGPYSVEHRGAFGGTFDLRTSLPEEFEMSMDVTGIIQDSHRFGRDEVLTGHKEFISAGNRFGDWSIYGFYNHLENEGQPQSFSAPNNDSPTSLQVTPGAGGTAVTGAQSVLTNKGNLSYLTGDLGINENITDLYELKVGYDFNPDLRALFTIAFEDTERQNQSNTYLRDANGNPVWGGNVTQDGYQFAANPLSFGNPALSGSENERKTLMYGFNLSGKLTDDWSIDTTASFFDAFKDVTYQSKHSRNNPAYEADKSGTITDNEIWWVDYSVKLATQNLFGNEDLGFMAGYQYNHSFLDIDRFQSGDVYSGARGVQDQSNGGSTGMHSAFMQADYDFLERWNILAGVRYDHWYATRGHVTNRGTTQDISDRDLDRLSPKASLSFKPVDDVTMRYSFSRAYRFAVAEELFNSATNSNFQNISDPTLAPESGNFHDFSIRYNLDQGYVSTSLFYNEIDNEIMNILTNVGGSISNKTRAIDKTETIGIEFVYRQDYIMDMPFGLDLNGTWLNKEIKADRNSPELVDKEWLRIPKWRANGTLTYHTTPEWDNIVQVQYRSKQFNQADNSDKQYRVYGSSSDYVLVNFKSAYKMDVGNGMTAKFSVGVDNILDEDYYEHHPYPQRTYFANIGLDI